MATKKLIEVSLPLEAINNGCMQEKNPFLKGHPRSTHLWWARRPLAAARAVLFAQLVDDPSSHPDIFPTEDEQSKERERLFGLISQISDWSNLHNDSLMQQARKEICKCWKYVCDEHPNDPSYDPNVLPAFHDPFAGGGGIPLEAQRLGLRTYASDLNPVATTINKAMIELPFKFEGQAPINPESSRLFNDKWEGATGLQADVRYYGKWMLDEAKKEIGDLYPDVQDNYGNTYKVIAWIWTRTGKCSNPACGCTIPFASTFVLSTKKGKEAWVEPIVENKKITFRVHKGKCPKDKETNKFGRGAIFKCPACGEVTTDEYVKNIALKGELGTQLMAIVGDSKNGRVYLPADERHISAASISCPNNIPRGDMPTNPRWFSPPAFGMKEFFQLFTNRQLKAMCTFCDLVSKAQIDVLKNGGSVEYAKAIAVYLTCGISQTYFCRCFLLWGQQSLLPISLMYLIKRNGYLLS